MRSKSILLLTLALGCGLIASIGISQVMDRRGTPQTQAGEMAPIYVAMVDIPANEQLTPQNVKLEEWPKDKVPPGSLGKLEEIQGKRCRTRLYAGEPILQGKLSGTDGRDGPADQIPKGYRVVSVRVDAVTGASSLILPGDRVDVILYMRRDASAGINDTRTHTILQDIKVFAVDTTVERDHESDDKFISAKTVSLLVTPKQAEKVTLAESMGTIRLAMRSPDDDLEQSTQGLSITEILGGSEKSDREDEHKAQTETETSIGGLKSWIEEQKQKLISAQQTNAPPADSDNWTMTVHQGPDVTQVDIAPDGRITGDGANPPGNAPPAASGAADQPSGDSLPTSPDASADEPATSPSHEDEEKETEPTTESSPGDPK